MQIAIVTYPGMTALDAIGPYEVLRLLPGAEIRFVWEAPGPITTDSGVLVLGATHAFSETPAPDIVLVPGGTATASAAANKELLGWLREVHETTRWTTSVCSGSLILGAAGLLEGRSATSHFLGVKALRGFGAEPVADRRIVQDGRVITAAGVSAGIDLALFLAGQIDGDETAQAIQLLIEYDPQPQYDSGHISKASAAVKRHAGALAASEGKRMVSHDPRLLAREAAAVPTLMWQRAIRRARGRRSARRRSVQVARDGTAPPTRGN